MSVGRVWAAVLLVAGALLMGAPAATASAATSPSTEADTTRPAPVLTSATIRSGVVRLLWQEPEGGAEIYTVYGDGKYLAATPSTAYNVYLGEKGLDEDAVFTVRAADDIAPDMTPVNESPDSNGLVAVPPVELQPTPVLTSGAFDRSAGTVTLNWTASHTDEISGELTYLVVAVGDFQYGFRDPVVARVTDVTTATFSLEQASGLFFLSGQEEYYVYAQDRTEFNQSQPSNRLVPTEV